uniref:Fatty-acid and retinol-binding protein 1 n=1 Tax=Heterodera avenae TaxID=34510 RepID=A0A0U4DEH9_HETAV|nr:fatty acid and retinol binding protein [Heterodera avenae]AMQ99047.1 fatty acid and retinol binding protein 1 [Heterodera avenae]
MNAVLSSLIFFGAVLLVSLHAATLPPIDINSIPQEYRELIPTEVTDFYNTLTEEDKQALKDVAERHEEFQTEDQAMEALKTKSEKLYNKAVELRNLVKGKIDALEPSAKEFVTGMIEKAKAMRPKTGEKPNLEELRKTANELIEKFKALSDGAKESLKTNFPKISGVIQNEKFQALAKSLLKPAEGAAPAA